jgi:hypothetical protein
MHLKERHARINGFDRNAQFEIALVAFPSP